ncbi:hypothetical protein OSTOST_11249, partial [Ostertagia ostertagi]
MGSNENSWFLYPRTKGEVERDVAALEFEKFLIVRPGMLEGPREVAGNMIMEEVQYDMVLPVTAPALASLMLEIGLVTRTL